MQKVRVCLYLTSTTQNLTYIMQEVRVIIFNVNYKNLTYIMQKVRVCVYI